ncbi:MULTISPECIES: MMPL family transporter [unclassified Actinotalea]|uniref:MMPL family transporter n=1 Tax=unclassified Actinotalea TaxID=2638618 RepID=UPI0015F73205|nr:MULTISPECIES: MMPL family transporter [unclassified Actinotalea]
MAELLYRLGRFSARRAWTVLVAWLVLLALAGIAYLTLGGTVSSAITIPGTATAEVTDRLEAELETASGGTASVVFHTADGSEITAEQRAGIAAAVARAADVDGVEATVDPFATEAERAGQAQQLAEGQAQLEAGRAQLAEGQAQLDAARAQAEVGQVQLDEARAQAEAAGMLAMVAPQLDAQQAQLDAGLALLDEQQAALDAARAELEAQEPVLADGLALLEMAEGFRTVSEDGSAAIATVLFTDPVFEVAPETKEAVRDAFTAEPVEGLEVDWSNELVAGVPNIGGAAEVVGVVVAALVLLVMLGTLVAAGLPLLTALIGVGIGALGTMALSGTVEMISVTPVLGIMLGLAVGIDYSLFILNRHRRQLREGADVHESIGLANGTSGNAVVFAGSTVIIALLALNMTGIPFLALMGTVAAFSVLVAVLVAVTATPALLALVGRRMLPRRQRTAKPTPPPSDLPPMSTGKAVLRLVVGVGVLLVVAIPALSMRLGLPDGSSEPEDSSQYRAYMVTADAFGEGVNGPLVVVADLPQGTQEADVMGLQARIGAEILAVDDVEAVVPVGTSDDLTLMAFQVVPAEGPNAVSTEELVHELRGMSVDGAEGELAVAGAASGNIDISEKLAAALPVYLAVVIGLSLIILVVVFRSLVVPLIATAGFILSVYAAFGGVVAIYQWGWLGDVFGVHDPGPVLSFLPIILVGVLFGLAMDYQLFLTSGMREAYAHGAGARRAVTQGVRAGRAVVTAAAIIMIAVFGGFVFSHTAIIRPIGFGLAFGVLVDAFLVRMLLVPALMHLVGEKAWWLPRWLDRLLPDVDVEGAQLERRHHAIHEDADDRTSVTSS